MKTLAEYQVEAVRALCDRQKSMHSLMSSEHNVLLSVGEVEGALAEGEQAFIEDEIEAEQQDT